MLLFFYLSVTSFFFLFFVRFILEVCFDLFLFYSSGFLKLGLRSMQIWKKMEDLNISPTPASMDWALCLFCFS